MSGVAIAEAYDAFEKGKIASPMAAASLSAQTISESQRLLLMVRTYQVSGEHVLQALHVLPCHPLWRSFP